MSMVNVIGFSLHSVLTEVNREKGNCFSFIWPPSLSSATSVSPSVRWEEALLGNLAWPQPERWFEAGHEEQAEGNVSHMRFSSSYHIIMVTSKLIVFRN